MKPSGRDISRISMGQLTTLLLVSRAMTLLTRSAAISVPARARETVIGLAVSVAVVLVFEFRPIASALRRIVPSKITKLFLIGYLLVASVRALMSFVVFVQSESEIVFPAVWITLLLTGVVFCALRSGIEGIARFALIIGVLFAVVLGFTVIANSARMDITNLGLVGEVSAGGMVETAAANWLLCPEIPAYFVLKRFVRQQDAGRRGFRTFFLAQSLGAAVFATAQELVFGALIQIQSYPIYSFAIVGEFSIFQRLDIIHLSIWCLITVVELSVLSVACETLISELWPRPGHTAVSAALCAVEIAGALLVMSILAADPAVLEWVMAGLSVAGVILFLCSARRRQDAEGEGKP